jgi:hypothetical protein
MPIVTEDAVCELLQTTLEVGEDQTEIYDVDMFIHDVINGYDWSGYTDPDDPINFITGVMQWCRTEQAGRAYSNPGLVIIFNELQDWAYKFWEEVNHD